MRVLTSAVAIAAVLSAMAVPAVGGPAVTHRTVAAFGTVAHVLTVPASTRVKPVAARPGKTVPGWAQQAGAVAAINGGYFNHSDGWPVSHVLADGRALTNPRENRALTANPVLQPVLPRIFDQRVEWRAYEGARGPGWAIAPHAAPAPAGQRVRHALQAGPALLPAMDLAGEAFVLQDARGRVVRDGIGTSSKAARSALGLTPAGELLLVAVAGSPRRGTGVTIAQLAALMRQLGAHAAMGLDGGSSTTLSWRENGRLRTVTGSGAGPVRVNSALVVMP
ncbi:MAG: phosphodiester glycosidase family protein [Candidatus Sericytochromatia bacterium]